MILAALLGCEPVVAVPSNGGVCAEVSAELGFLACVHEVPDAQTFQSVSISSTVIDRDREAKYLAPAGADAPLPTLVVNTNAFALHLSLIHI